MADETSPPVTLQDFAKSVRKLVEDIKARNWFVAVADVSEITSELGDALSVFFTTGRSAPALDAEGKDEFLSAVADLQVECDGLRGPQRAHAGPDVHGGFDPHLIVQFILSLMAILQQLHMKVVSIPVSQ